jgi:predicted metal-binding protein
LDKYIQLAKDLKMEHALLIGPKDIYFDSRAVLKCLWGCEEHTPDNIRCNTRGSTLAERMDIVKSYHDILLLHSHDVTALSSAILAIEKKAFLDGHYFAAGMRGCNLCKECSVKNGRPCPTPQKIRPCESSFGIDMYKTVRNLGLPCEVLQNKTDSQNRYGFVLID